MMLYYDFPVSIVPDYSQHLRGFLLFGSPTSHVPILMWMHKVNSKSLATDYPLGG
jgi:hypothetical protein